MRMRLRTMLWILAGLVGEASAAEGPRRYLDRPDGWFATEEARRVAANILSHQSELGGWPKNIDTTATPYAGDRKALKPTFDNGATTDELRFLARLVRASKDEHAEEAFGRGLDYILKAQYPGGGWPQFAPPGRAYHRHITFNDGAMVRLLEFLREVSDTPTYDFVAPSKREAARAAFAKGVACILRCQVRVEGRRTAWCAQHDEVDDRPRPGRSFELASLSGSESVGIVRLLMSLKDPSPEVVDAVEAAVAWFDAVKLVGIRQVERPDPHSPTGRNKVVVDDPSAPPLWARFYEIGTNRPLFADRDGVPKSRLADIGYERRNGYAWLVSSPQSLLEREYPAWKRTLAGKAGGR